LDIDERNLSHILEILRGTNFPVFISEDMKLTAWPKKGFSPNKAIILSIPKAGTYLISKLLTLLGMEFTNLHLSPNSLTDYRFTSIIEGGKNPEKLTINMKLWNALNFIEEGQFAVGHLRHTANMKLLLKQFKKIFLYRNLREVFVSHMRFVCDTERDQEYTKPFRNLPDGPEKIMKHMKIYKNFLIGETHHIIGWLNEDDVLKISFEDIYGDKGKDKQKKIIHEVCQFLDLEKNKIDSEKILEHLIGSPTLTWSGERSKLELFWNDEVESLFIEIRGKEINQELGYE